MKSLILAICMSTLVIGNAEAKVRLRHKSVPTFSAKSFLIASEDGTILKEKNGDTVRPIASISKLMIALLATEQDVEESLSIPSTRHLQSKIPRTVEFLTRYELLTLALIKSDNLAAQILCDNLPNCVQRMNDKAAELGMVNTHYKESTGLDRGNVSTAHDLLKLMLAASSNYFITSISSQPTAEIFTKDTSIKIHNTNPLTASNLPVWLSKTGFTNPAGGCLIMAVNFTTGMKYFVLLGSRNTKTRITEMKDLVKRP